jgi:acid phosphatase (class A)
MIPSRRRLLGAALVCLISVPGLAGELPYLTARSLDLVSLLPPPPPLDSPLQAAEVAAVIAAQQIASPERIALAVADTDEAPFEMFARTLGPRFAAPALPKTTILFAGLGASEEAVVNPAKKTFARLRPYLADSRIKALVSGSRSGSWPSGHATRVTVVAIVLSAMLPEYRAAIWARAAEYAQSRVIGGMHYPLDLDAGGRAGTAIAAALFGNPVFQADFEVARAETRAALGL